MAADALSVYPSIRLSLPGIVSKSLNDVIEEFSPTDAQFIYM